MSENNDRRDAELNLTMRLFYVPALACYAVRFGDSFLSFDLRDSGPMRRFWQSRAEAVAHLTRIGFQVSARGILS